jgi:hypothetical protein
MPLQHRRNTAIQDEPRRYVRPYEPYLDHTILETDKDGEIVRDKLRIIMQRPPRAPSPKDIQWQAELAVKVTKGLRPSGLVTIEMPLAGHAAPNKRLMDYGKSLCEFYGMEPVDFEHVSYGVWHATVPRGSVNIKAGRLRGGEIATYERESVAKTAIVAATARLAVARTMEAALGQAPIADRVDQYG